MKDPTQGNRHVDLARNSFVVNCACLDLKTYTGAAIVTDIGTHSHIIIPFIV